MQVFPALSLFSEGAQLRIWALSLTSGCSLVISFCLPSSAHFLTLICGMIQEFNIWTNGNFGFGSVMLKKHSTLSVGILWGIPDALLVFFYVTQDWVIIGLIFCTTNPPLVVTGLELCSLITGWLAFSSSNGRKLKTESKLTFICLNAFILPLTSSKSISRIEKVVLIKRCECGVLEVNRNATAVHQLAHRAITNGPLCKSSNQSALALELK